MNGVESGLGEVDGGGSDVCGGKNDDEVEIDGWRDGKDEKRSCASDGEVGWKDVGGRSCRTAHSPLEQF